MNYTGTSKLPTVTFEEAVAKWRLLPAIDKTTPFDLHKYESSKDTVPRGQMANVCQQCHFPLGTPGFVRLTFPIGHPLFGKPIPCPRCNKGGR